VLRSPPARALALPVGLALAAGTWIAGEHLWLGERSLGLAGDILVDLIPIVLLALLTSIVRVRRSAEQERLVAALIVSEERARAAIDEAPDGILLSDETGRYVEANPAICRLLGYTRDELLAQRRGDLDVQDDTSAIREIDILRRAVDDGEAIVVEHRLRHKDGHAVPVEMSVRRLPDGRVQRIVRDTTDRLRSEAERARLASQLGAIFDAAPLAILAFDRDATLVSWNAAAERILGWSADEVVGGPYPGVDLRGDSEAAERFRRVLAGESLANVAALHHAKDGHPVPIRLWLAPLRDAGGVVDGVLSIVEDVSPGFAAEEERIRLSTAVEQAAEAIVITDPDGTIVYVNPAFTRVSGYSRAELIGANPRVLKSGRHDRAFYEELWRTLLRGDTWSGTLVNRHRDGSIFEEEATIAPIRDSAGVVQHYVGVKRDVTREHALEGQVAWAQRMEAVGQLAGGVAHDFNNLLTAIGGYAELLRDAMAPEDPRRTDAEEILRATGSAAGLVRQLLAFSRRVVLKPEIVAIEGLIDDLRPMLTRLLGASITLAIETEPGVDAVLADRGQLEQVIVNLTVNARDAMPDGGTFTLGLAKVTLEARAASERGGLEPGRYVLLTARDTGLGMDEATLARVFEPFFTTKAAGQGTGLGLASAYGVVKQSGGYIFAESAPGAGATFSVFLPSAESTGLEPATTAAAPVEPVSGGSETILLVEDEPGVRALACTMLERLGYRVLVAEEASVALRLADEATEPIDLLVTDIHLPGIAGTDLAELLRRAHANLPVLFVSAYPFEATAHRSTLSEDTAFLSKPFTAETLGRHVRTALDRHSDAA